MGQLHRASLALRVWLGLSPVSWLRWKTGLLRPERQPEGLPHVREEDPAGGRPGRRADGAVARPVPV